MGLGEFELIGRYFHRAPRTADVGVGDDCAIWTLTQGTRLAVSSDMLVEGRHFLSTVAPERLGHKALAVNLSDLAACGARPRAFTLAMALPQADSAWLEGFSRGLLALADAHDCELVGGDTTRGPLNLCITVMGEVPLDPAQVLLRSGARAGDDLYVSGTVGDARLALEAFRGRLSLSQSAFDDCRLRMEMPTPRVALGLALRGIASAAIDVSDGLLGDLGHILRASGVGATVHSDVVLDSAATSAHVKALPSDLALECALAGGDDYELVFTAPAAQRLAVGGAAARAGCPVTCIGHIDAEPGTRVLDARGRPVAQSFGSFDHFMA